MTMLHSNVFERFEGIRLIREISGNSKSYQHASQNVDQNFEKSFQSLKKVFKVWKLPEKAVIKHSQMIEERVRFSEILKN